MPRTIATLFSIVCLALISPSSLGAWRLEGTNLEPVAIPAGVIPVSMGSEGDLDLKGGVETLLLNDGRLSIMSGKLTRWASPSTWNVEQAFISDLNHDGRLEASLLVSRPFQGWPVDAWLPSGGRINEFHDLRGISSHIILIGWQAGRFDEQWAGSALAEPVDSMAYAFLGRREKPYLITLEKRYDDPPSWSPRILKVWDWNGFGFSVVYSLAGPFARVVVTQSEEDQMLIMDRPFIFPGIPGN